MKEDAAAWIAEGKRIAVSSVNAQAHEFLQKQRTKWDTLGWRKFIPGSRGRIKREAHKIRAERHNHIRQAEHEIAVVARLYR